VGVQANQLDLRALGDREEMEVEWSRP